MDRDKKEKIVDEKRETKEPFIKSLNNLLKVKSIMTILVMIVFTTLALTHCMSDELIASVITAVITYYFTKKQGD